MDIKLRKNAWHWRLQEIYFGTVPFTKNLCPYFWLTLFCLFTAWFVFPVKWLFQLTGFIFSLVDKYIFTPFDLYCCNPLLERVARQMTYHDVLNCYRHSNYDSGFSSFSRRKDRMLKIWIKLVGGSDWQTQIRNFMLSEIEWMEAQEEIRKERREKRQATYTTLIKVTKFLFPFAVLAALAVIVLIVYWLVRFALWLKVAFNFASFVAFCKVFAFIIGCVLGAIVIGWAIKKLVECPISIKLPNFRIAEKLTVCWEIFLAFKQNYCPGISWVEDADKR